MSNMGEFVLPGDKIYPLNATRPNQQHKLCGRGIVARDEEPHASVAGVVHENLEKVWVNSFYRRYFAQTGDKVIGIVTHKIGDSWRVDIGGIEKAEIEFTSFENATKRNRPDVRLGDLLYGHVTVINKHLEPIMQCVDSLGKARGMGLLARSGTIFTVSCSYSRRLLTDSCKIIPLLAKTFIFEITVGVNGRIWVNCSNYDDLRFLRIVLLRCEKVAESDVEQVIKGMVTSGRGNPSQPITTTWAKPSTTPDVDIKEEGEIKDEIEDDDPMNTL